MTDPFVIESDGPRRLVRLPLSVRFGASCSDCGWVKKFDHQVDAQDALDNHRCEAQP